MKNIQQITALETFSARHIVHRAKKLIVSCRFDGDTLETRLVDSDNLLGVVSLFEAKNDSFIIEKQFQIQGMAVLKQHQKLSLGEKLINHAEKQKTEFNLVQF